MHGSCDGIEREKMFPPKLNRSDGGAKGEETKRNETSQREKWENRTPPSWADKKAAEEPSSDPTQFRDHILVILLHHRHRHSPHFFCSATSHECSTCNACGIYGPRVSYFCPSKFLLHSDSFPSQIQSLPRPRLRRPLCLRLFLCPPICIKLALTGDELFAGITLPPFIHSSTGSQVLLSLGRIVFRDHNNNRGHESGYTPVIT